MSVLDPTETTGPLDVEFTGGAGGRRWAGGTVLTFLTAEGDDVALRLEEDDLASLYRMLHGWGVWHDPGAKTEGDR